MRIRKMRAGDIGQIVRLIHDVYGREDVRQFLKDLKISLAVSRESPYKFEDFFVVVIDDEIIAVGGAWALHYEPIARLDWFIVGREHQKKGMGTLLLKFIEGRLKKRRISILIAETSSAAPYRAAALFYEKNGFKKVSRIENYWPDGSAWLCFVKRI